MIKNYITFLLLLSCFFVQGQDLILDVQSGLIPESRQDASPIENELSLQRHETEIIKPFSFVRQSTEEESTLFLTLDQNIRRQILKHKANYIQLAIPVDGTHELELEFYKKDILSPGFIIETSDGQIDNTFADRSVFYHGMVKNHQESWATLAVYENEITIFIHDKEGKYTLGKVKDSSEYVFYNEDVVVPDVDRACGTTEIGNAERISIPEEDLENARMMNCPVRVYIETDFETWTGFVPQTQAAITTHVTNMMTEIIAMYATINIPMQLSQVFVWTTDDGYGNSNPGGTGTGTLLTNFGNGPSVSGGFNGTIAHLLTIRAPGFSGSIAGIAGVGVVCNAPSNATGYSQVYSTFMTFPTYSASISLFGHELGHNMGSDHTGECVWNGNNTAIDDCGGGGGGTTCTATNSQGGGYIGTLMSYCNTSTLSFHPQVQTVMQAHYAAASTNCLATCGTPTCTDGVQNGQETGVDCGGSTCPACPNCTDGVQNGQETGVDCGGPTCPACPCAGTLVVLSITFDNYPEETSWTLTDGNGATVASGGPYPNEPDGSTLTENICLADGCYDFIISDTEGDGICCGFGTGSYSVTGGGTTLASGAQFTMTETTNICVGGGGGPTCTDGIQNGQETGVDCGGPTCPACPCAGTLVILSITFDDYPEETSWTITDGNGATVASGGPYPTEPDGSTLTENICLADGCYDFIISDTEGDGICCGFGTGSYSVTGGGSTLASGGQFTNTETTNFCVGSGGGGCTNAPPANGTIAGGNYFVNASVTTAGQVVAGTNVDIKSSSEINLGPGFEIISTGTFSATIGTCTLFQPDAPVSSRLYNDNESKVESKKSSKLIKE